VSLQVPASVQSFSITSVDSGTPSVSGSTISVININGVKPGKDFHITLSITVAANTACQADSFTGRAWTGNTLGGTEFSASPTGGNVAAVYVGCDGVLDCNQTIGNPIPSDVTLDGTPDYSLTRGQNASCQKVPYNFDFITNGSQTASFLVVKNGQAVVADYVMAWMPVDINGPTGLVNGWPAFRPYLSWGVDNPNPNLPPAAYDYVPGLACLGNDLSDPAVMPMIPNVEPFITASTYHSQYTPNTQAKMCIVEHDWALVNVGGVMKIQYLDRVFDKSDGHVVGP
jgi:hypothetical protein